MAELKPCPFCGGESLLLHNAKRKIYGKDEYRIGVVACCSVCEARMFYGSESLATEAWNRRATIDPERKKGKWFWGDGMYSCDQCHAAFYETSPFCPMCGADMRKGTGMKYIFEFDGDIGTEGTIYYQVIDDDQKIREHEQNCDLKIGDEILFDGNVKGVVYNISDRVYCFTENATIECFLRSEIKKTGRYFPEIIKILKELQEEQ